MKPDLVTEVSTRMAVQFQRLGAFHELPGARTLDPETESALLGIDAGTLRDQRAEMARVTAATTSALLDAEGVCAAVRGLTAGTIACVGDSLTADHQSWAELVRGVVARLRPDIEVLNLGRSGDTTLDVVRRLPAVLAGRRPSIFVILVGSNDACRNVPVPDTMFVSDAETRRNLAGLAEIVAARGARALWVTPPPLLEDLVAAFPVFAQMGIRYLREDVARKAQAVRELEAPTVDLWSAFDATPLERMLLPDGLHLSAHGQAEVARRVLRALA